MTTFPLSVLDLAPVGRGSTPADALASSLRLFGRRRMPLFVAGAAAGAALLWLR